MTTDRDINILSASVNGTKVSVGVALNYLKSGPVEFPKMEPDEAIRLAEQLISAARLVYKRQLAEAVRR